MVSTYIFLLFGRVKYKPAQEVVETFWESSVILTPPIQESTKLSHVLAKRGRENINLLIESKRKVQVRLKEPCNVF